MIDWLRSSQCYNKLLRSPELELWVMKHIHVIDEPLACRRTWNVVTVAGQLCSFLTYRVSRLQSSWVMLSLRLVFMWFVLAMICRGGFRDSTNRDFHA